jgi:hypothetical protein
MEISATQYNRVGCPYGYNGSFLASDNANYFEFSTEGAEGVGIQLFNLTADTAEVQASINGTDFVVVNNESGSNPFTTNGVWEIVGASVISRIRIVKVGSVDAMGFAVKLNKD